MNHEKNKTYWEFNLPLQVMPAAEGEPERILNYMPRRSHCQEIELDEETLGEQTREEFLNTAADHLENLAKLMRRAATDPNYMVYYHDKDPNK